MSDVPADVAAFLAADTTNVLAAETTDVMPADTTQNTGFLWKDQEPATQILVLSQEHVENVLFTA